MIKIKSFDLKKDKIATLIIPVCEDKRIHPDPDVSALIDEALTHSEFKGRKEDEIVLYNLPGTNTERVVFLGLGKFKKIVTESLRSFSGRAVKMCIGKELMAVVIVAPSAGSVAIDEKNLITAMLEGGILANDIFDAYKKEKKKQTVKDIFFQVPPAVAKKHARLPARVSSVCRAALLARKWINTPANDKRPEVFAGDIADRAKKAGLGVTVLTEAALKKQGFGAMLAVSAGSDSKPRLVVLTHAPKGAKKTLALVGKGVTFDTGGINLKPTGSIETMKTDMSGAAAVAATLLAAARLKPKIKIIGVLPIVENMLSGNATRPGDIVKTFEGKTVEILNTDAEGRLILIDAMAWVIKRHKPDTVIDLATLTGACVMALGEKIAGVFSEDDELADAIVSAGDTAHERCWRLPLPEDYGELLKSDVADLSNIGSSRWGGAITAALFLKAFVGDTQWAHLDIAGPARAAKAGPYCETGGTGFGVRLLCNLIDKL